MISWCRTGRGRKKERKNEKWVVFTTTLLGLGWAGPGVHARTAAPTGLGLVPLVGTEYDPAQWSQLKRKSGKSRR